MTHKHSLIKKIIGGDIADKKKFRLKQLLLITLAFAFIGTIVLIRSFAAGPVMSLQAAGVTPSGNATTKSDTTASGQSFIQFGVQNTGGESVVPVAPAAGKTWQKTFFDEFEGTAIDSSKWVTCWPWEAQSGCGGNNSGEQQWYLPTQVTVSGGAAHMIGDRCSSGCNGKPYKSGMLSSVRDLNSSSAPSRYFKYGYFEARMRVPTGNGFWPAFWLLTPSSPYEIDIMEQLGHERGVNLYYHWNTYNNKYGGYYDPGYDLRNSWHTYAVLWRADRITWYIDGVQAQTISGSQGSIANTNQMLLFNLALSGWPGAPNVDATTPLPSSADIDYVRVYEEK